MYFVEPDVSYGKCILPSTTRMEITNPFSQPTITIFMFYIFSHGAKDLVTEVNEGVLSNAIHQ